MTLKELNALIPDTHEIWMVDSHYNISELQRDDVLQMAAYGDFVISTIEASDTDKLQISFLLKPIKKGE